MRRRGLALPLLGSLAVAACLVAACTSADTTRALGPPHRARPAGAHRRRCPELARLALRVRRGYVRHLSPDIPFIPHEPNFVGSLYMPVHSGPWDYLAHVPLVLFGPPFITGGGVATPATMADLAPTTARLVGFSGWPKRDGRVLEESLRGSPLRPRLVVTVVWDGGGWNVLRRHPSSWPFLRGLMARGASYDHMTIGSSPSVTPAIHTTLGTGAWPDHNGIPGLTARTSAGAYVDPFLGLDTSRIRLGTLSDLYDAAGANRPVTGMLAAVDWHLGMIGHGASFPGGDRDPAVLLGEDGAIFGNESLFSLPAIGNSAALATFTRGLDQSDGKVDGFWKQHSLEDPYVRFSTPANVDYEEWLLQRLIVADRFGRDAVPDLLYVNFKSSDNAGHRWGMTSPEVGRVLRAQDDALRRLVSFLDRRVGRRRWVIAITADHGQTRYPQQSGAWPIGGAELKGDVNAALDTADDGIDLVDRVVSPGAYLNGQELAANHITAARVARWIARYTVAENVKSGRGIPSWFGGRPHDPLFDGVMVGGRLVARSCRP